MTERDPFFRAHPEPMWLLDRATHRILDANEAAAEHYRWSRDEFAAMNRPGFPRGFFVQNLRGFFKGVHLCVERLLDFLRRPMGNGAV